MAKSSGARVVPAEFIERRIHVIRECKVMLSHDLAELYGVDTKQLTRAVRRNLARFPPDFMFQLKDQEVRNLRCQFGTSSSGYGGHRYLPLAFTEHGIAMLSSVLNSPRAVAVNIEIMRTFIRMREMLVSNKELASKLDELEKKVGSHNQAIVGIFKTLQELMKPPEPKKRSIGFVELEEKES